MHSHTQHLINHNLTFIDTSADTEFPVESDRQDLWDQSNVQLAMPLTSKCCDALVIEHRAEFYCTGCGQNIRTHQHSDEVENIVNH